MSAVCDGSRQESAAPSLRAMAVPLQVSGAAPCLVSHVSSLVSDATSLERRSCQAGGEDGYWVD